MKIAQGNVVTPPFLVAATDFLPFRYSETRAVLSETSQLPKPTYCMAPFVLNVPSGKL